jgi:hypothetical protein
VRILLWLPFCGLFASLFFPPQSEDLAGAIRFAAIVLGAAGLAIVTAGVLQELDERARVLYSRLAPAGAVLVIGAAVVTAILT